MKHSENDSATLGEQYPALAAALNLDMAQEQMVTFICQELGITSSKRDEINDDPAPFLALVFMLREHATDLGNLRTLETEYMRLIAESQIPGRVALQLMKLWITDSRTLDVKHRDGYKLSDFRGGAYLIPSGNDWEIVYADRGYAECAHETASGAADRLERLTKDTRDKLGRAYSALELLSREAAPPARKSR